MGYNYQFNAIVLGLQGEFNGSSASGSRADAGAFTGLNVKTNQDWFGSIDGRLGFAANRALFYGVGGFAFTDADAAIAAGGATVARYSTTRAGYDLGAGVEYAFTNNVTGRVEYRYYDFSANSLTATPTVGSNSNKLTDQTVRVGLSYKFSNPEAVVAKF